jgi:hypothetical protein
MPDSRPTHTHYRPSLLNIPTPPFEGAANSLYGKRGPQGPANTGRRRPLSGEPMSLEHHVQDAIARTCRPVRSWPCETRS